LLASLDEYSLQLWSTQSAISAFEDFLPPPTTLREEMMVSADERIMVRKDM
jgi:hypothetical protein